METSITYEYLTALEFYVLMAAAGRNKWYGPVLEQKNLISSQEDLNRVLTSLYQKGDLDWENKTAILPEKLKTAFANLKKARTCIVLTRPEGTEYTVYVYPAGDNITEISVSSHDQDSFRITDMTMTEWLGELQGEELFSDPIEKPTDSISQKQSVKDAAAILELHDVMSGKLKQSLTVVDKGLYSVLVLENGAKQTVSLCTKEEFEKILRSWAGKEKK